MASIIKQPNGRKAIQFTAGDGKRPTISLGKASQKIAESVKRRVEELNVAKITDHPIDRDTALWLAEIDDSLSKRLAKVGLIPKRESDRLASFVDGYISSRADVKPATATVYGHTRRCLVEYFGVEKPLREITPGDADNWRLWLIDNEKLSPNTVRRRCGIAKQFFRAAARQKLIHINPFADLVCAVQANTSRYHFISREDSEKIIKACPDNQWKLIFALSRYGGLRCPSEHLALQWGHIDWDRGRMEVPSPKTEHHAGGETRTVPLFPELRPYLQATLDELLEDFDPKQKRLSEQPVITRYRDSRSNLRTHFERIIRKAGLKPWPKLFQNLRSTRETELAENHPLHKVCTWIGNSIPVAAKHYLQVTDEDFEIAAGLKSERPTEALHNPMQQTSEMVCSALHSAALQDENSEKSDTSSGLMTCGMGDEGLEPPTSTL